jgi:transposase
LSRHLEALEKTVRQQHNRLEACVDETVQQSLQTIIRQLEHHITQITQQIQAHVDHTPELKRDQDLLCSIIGLGTKTAHTIMAEVPNMTTYPSARTVAAHAGVTPKHSQSGISIHGKPKLCKMGNARLRKALYFPAISAIQHNPLITQFANRLRQHGKSEMCIIGAVMRKLLHLSYGVLKHRQSFDPNFLHNA